LLGARRGGERDVCLDDGCGRAPGGDQPARQGVARMSGWSRGVVRVDHVARVQRSGRSLGLWVAPAGFSFVGGVGALSFVSSVGVLASGAASAFITLAHAAHAEAVGLAAATEKLEELIATPAAARASGNDETAMGEVAVTRVWRVRAGDPVRDLDRI